MKDIPWPEGAEERAAGVLLFRRTDRGVRFLTLRNARHRTWGFAKGRAERDETPLATARREVLEETGIDRFRLDPEFVATIDYRVATGDGRSHRKLVVYFLGETAQEAVISGEHDEHRWISAHDARRLLPHVNLRGVIERAEAWISRTSGPSERPGV